MNDLHEQKVCAIGERIGVLRKELTKSLDIELRKELLKKNQRHPNTVFFEWVITELAVILFNQEQITNNWNARFGSSKSGSVQ